MKYKITISERAQKEINDLRKGGNKALLRKLHILISELETSPTEGQGKPEQLDDKLEGLWSRRLNHEDRLIYNIQETPPVVKVVSVHGHYLDLKNIDKE